MKDRDFLIWLHERLVNTHDENPLFDYMHKLRVIIYNYPKGKESPNIGKTNNMAELAEDLKELDLRVVRPIPLSSYMSLEDYLEYQKEVLNESNSR